MDGPEMNGRKGTGFVKRIGFKIGLKSGTRRAGLPALLIVAGVLVTSCTSAPSNQGSAADQNAGQPSNIVQAKPVSLATHPASGANGVAPGEPVVVTATEGKINDVKLVGADGAVVEGAVKPDASGWESSQGLGYGKTYT